MKEVFEPIRRKLRIPNRMHDVLVTHVLLDASRVMAILSFKTGKDVLMHFVPGYKADPEDELNEGFVQSPPEHSDANASASEEERAKRAGPGSKTQ